MHVLSNSNRHQNSLTRRRTAVSQKLLVYEQGMSVFEGDT